MQNSSCFLTRSGYLSINVQGQGANEYGFAWNVQGYQYTANSNNPAAVVWAGASDIYNTFDAYRILKVQVTFQYSANSATESSIATFAQLPFLYVAKDYDDINTTAGSVTELLQRPDCTQVVLGKSSGFADYRTTIVPKVAPIAYATSVSSAYMEPKAKQWINCGGGLTGALTDAPHYGLKCFIDATDMASTNYGVLRVYFKVFFECKHPY